MLFYVQTDAVAIVVIFMVVLVLGQIKKHHAHYKLLTRLRVIFGRESVLYVMGLVC